MPFKDPEQKKRWQRNWVEKKLSKGYGAWLYKRRKAFQEDAANFRQALEEIIAVSEDETAHTIAELALTASEERWRKLAEERKQIF